jgi:hypothetical protein
VRINIQRGFSLAVTRRKCQSVNHLLGFLLFWWEILLHFQHLVLVSIESIILVAADYSIFAQEV